MEQPKVDEITVETVSPEFSAENMISPYFPRLSAGVLVNKKICRLVKNNTENLYEIDWAICIDGVASAWLDVEHKQSGWGYPAYTVAIYTMKWNKGQTNLRHITNKVALYRTRPLVSFWMPIRLDYKEAGIVVGKDIIESPIVTYPARGMARDIEAYACSSYLFVFTQPYTTAIEDYIFKNLHRAGVL